MKSRLKGPRARATLLKSGARAALGHTSTPPPFQGATGEQRPPPGSESSGR